MTKAKRRPAPPSIHHATEALALLVQMERELYAEGDRQRHLQLIRLHVWITNLVTVATLASQASDYHRTDLLAEVLGQLRLAGWAAP